MIPSFTGPLGSSFGHPYLPGQVFGRAKVRAHVFPSRLCSGYLEPSSSLPRESQSAFPGLWKVDTHLCAPSGPKSGQACMKVGPESSLSVAGHSDIAQSQGWGEKRVVQGTHIAEPTAFKPDCPSR